MLFTEIVKQHTERYPKMQAQDYVKLACQHALGCGHMIKDAATALLRIQSERINDRVFSEDIGNGLIRLHLNGGETRLSDAAVSEMFLETANGFQTAPNALESALSDLSDMSEKGLLTVSHAEMTGYLSDYRRLGMPIVSHTEAYRRAYAPAYRVTNKSFQKLFPVIQALEALKREKPGAIACIDGMCASGKTTLSALLSRILAAPVYHMDDFFLPPEKRTRERLSEIGGNVDYERFQSEVLQNLKAQKCFSFRPFDCSTMSLSAPVSAEPAALSLVEGAYACHPTLINAYDLIIVMTIDEETQRARILKRNGPKMLERFINEWIPMENRYLSYFDIKDKADFRLESCTAG